MNTIKACLLATGVVGLTVAVASPSIAGTPLQAYASGSSVLVLQNGASVSVGGEIAAPQGAGFIGASGTTLLPQGDVNVVPTLTAFTGGTSNLSDNNVGIANLTVTPGTANLTIPAGSSFEAAVANLITTNTNLDQYISLTRAWKSGLQ